MVSLVFTHIVSPSQSLARSLGLSRVRDTCVEPLRARRVCVLCASVVLLQAVSEEISSSEARWRAGLRRWTTGGRRRARAVSSAVVLDSVLPKLLASEVARKLCARGRGQSNFGSGFLGV